jgi:outer membrane protein assembly factor BamB
MKQLLTPVISLLALGRLRAKRTCPSFSRRNWATRSNIPAPAPRKRGYSYAASDKEITVFNNKTGAVRWTGKFKDLTPKLNKVDELSPFWESNVLFLFDRKMGKDQIACLDLADGHLLWEHGQVPERHR